MAKSPEELAHQEWLGYVQPVGLVVSIPAMLQAQCSINKNVMEVHNEFLSCLPKDDRDDIIPKIKDLPNFLATVLEWEPDDLIRVPKNDALTVDLESLEVILPQYHETLRPSYAVPEFKPEEGESPWLMLIQEYPSDTEFDEPAETDSAKNWNAAPQTKFERLLRETGVSIGLMINETQLRLVYSPRGETSGYATFNVSEMVQVNGRPMFAALHMLLSAERLFTLGESERLPAILENSRKYQNTVSTELAEQVLAALYELMRGFQAANDSSDGKLLKETLKNDPNHVYSGLLTVLMRLVFVMYAEDRSLLSDNPVYSNHYSVTGLFNRLREEAGRYPDTMYQRYGAWSQLITLYRLIYEGGQHGSLRLRGRSGYLFDPNRYPFLEGRQRNAKAADIEEGDDAQPIFPRVPDGVVFNVLQNLLILNGERLSYRSLDVEQIGSVYETVMGFNLEVATGTSIAIKPAKSNGAPATINLEELLGTEAKDRAKWLKEHADQKLGTADAKLLKTADSVDGLLEALDKKVAKRVTPKTVPKGSIVLQPSDERRRSGSHYTPRSLTQPIVTTTLEPILKQLVEGDIPSVWAPGQEDKKRYTPGQIEVRIERSGRSIDYAKAAKEKGAPHPQQILELKICDPAMGSGAFLVEACRQLGDELIKAWRAHELLPTDIPDDEDEVLYARRLVAQRCLYGVDKNVMAVDLAKLSLWLVTLAKEHAFTFLDHSLCHGDSLVGLTREQIIGFHWDIKKQKKFGEDLIQKRLDRAIESRAKILNAREDVPYKDQERRLSAADEALDVIRMLGDACVSCFFAESKKKAREDEVDRVFVLAQIWLESFRTDKADVESRHSLFKAAARLCDSPLEYPVPAFHWEIEFPEVFSRDNGGFDAFVGNPPFLGGRNISASYGSPYLDLLQTLSPDTSGGADMVAHFFRQSFCRLRKGGTLGLIATNTIAQGVTRSSGLRVICSQGGVIYEAVRRYKWPGEAAVTVSLVFIQRQPSSNTNPQLDRKPVEKVSAFLFHRGGNNDPATLKVNDGLSYQGSITLGMGFTFDDTKNSNVVSSLALMNELVQKNPKNQELIFPYIGGDEINSHPSHEPHRYVINFGERSLEEAKEWPDLLEILERNVMPDRLKKSKEVASWPWWHFWRTREELYGKIAKMERVLVTNAQASTYLAFVFYEPNVVFANSLNIIVLDGDVEFGALQSSVHEIWARFCCSSLEDRLRYNPTDCFDTFPFPLANTEIELAARTYYETRSKRMVENNEGLTTTYNRIHSPDEHDEGILGLRRLHGVMDEAVLRAYGWDDLADSASCEFLLDYEEDEDDSLSANKKKSNKKKPWRYRWPDNFRDEVLARLLELNELRHKEEVDSAEVKTKPKATKKTDKMQGKLL